MEKSRSFHSSSYYSFGYDGDEDQNRDKSYNFNGPSASSDPELKRKKRVASYNVLTMEGKLKSSFKSRFKWIKTKFTDIRYGA